MQGKRKYSVNVIFMLLTMTSRNTYEYWSGFWTTDINIKLATIHNKECKSYPY